MLSLPYCNIKQKSSFWIHGQGECVVKDFHKLSSSILWSLMDGGEFVGMRFFQIERAKVKPKGQGESFEEAFKEKHKCNKWVVTLRFWKIQGKTTAMDGLSKEIMDYGTVSRVTVARSNSAAVTEIEFLFQAIVI